MTTHAALEVDHVSRHFGRNRFEAVRDVSLAVTPGQVHALLGPNGAGKTTLVRMCSTLLTPSSGHIRVRGVDVVEDPRRARRQLGVVLGGELGFYPRASARDNLLFFADVAGVPSRLRRTEVTRALERVNLSGWETHAVSEFSRGMRQRLHIARALLGAPPLLLLDEPTTGLDPEAALSVRELVLDLVSSGTAVLLTSHSMAEIEELASVITLIGRGQIVVSGQVSDIAQRAGIGDVTTATLAPEAVERRDDLAQAVGPTASVSLRPHGPAWSLTIYWPVGEHPQADRLRPYFEQWHLRWPSDVFTRPASLEDAYLAIAGDLAR